MKKLVLLFSLSLVTTLFSVVTFAGQCYFYKDSNLRNLILIAGPGYKITNLKDIGINDQISSVSCDGGTTAVLFQDSTYRGQAVMVPDPLMSSNNMGDHDGFNDKASSIVVTDAPLAWLYDSKDGFLCNGCGWVYPAAVNVVVPRLAGRNDELSSVSVPDGFNLKIWIDSPPTTDTSSVDYANWYNNPSYVVNGRCCGNQFPYTNTWSMTNLNLPSDINNKASAIELKSGTDYSSPVPGDYGPFP